MAEKKDSTMADNNKKTTGASGSPSTESSSSSSSSSSAEETMSMNLKGYERLINRMQEERKELQKELSKDYEEARHYVRDHPEEGVLYAFIGGLAIGLLLGTTISGSSNRSGT